MPAGKGKRQSQKLKVKDNAEAQRTQRFGEKTRNRNKKCGRRQVEILRLRNPTPKSRQ